MNSIRETNHLNSHLRLNTLVIDGTIFQDLVTTQVKILNTVHHKTARQTNFARGVFFSGCANSFLIRLFFETNDSAKDATNRHDSLKSICKVNSEHAVSVNDNHSLV